jgi:DNA replication and repair protein RecF
MREEAGLRDQIAAFNGRLAATGARIREARVEYVQSLGEILAAEDGPGELVPGGPPVLEYRPSPRLPAVGTEASLEEALFRGLEGQYEAERRRGHALAGAQRDDLLIRQGDADLARYGSSGQQRAGLIALKICKMLVQNRIRGEYPVLLVDDVDAELDAERTRRALALLDGPFQAFVASARAPEWLRERRLARHLMVRNGIIDRLK